MTCPHARTTQQALHQVELMLGTGVIDLPKLRALLRNTEHEKECG